MSGTSSGREDPGQVGDGATAVEVVDGRAAEVGGFAVARVLPLGHRRRTVGAWCFVDLMGPGVTTADHGLDVGPHPHIGLQTVTWLLDGAVLHRDSLGSEQVIHPGQLNLMTAGAGIAHSEETTGTHTGALHGVQLWVAQPAETRNGPPAFEHHAELPVVGLANGAATVLAGTLMGVTSPARGDTSHVGADLDLRAGRTVVALDPRFEYAVVPLTGPVAVGGGSGGSGDVARPGQLAYLGPGRGANLVDALDMVVMMMRDQDARQPPAA
ncbi:MAG TPA: pirin family protein, partial [Ilumatobacteraceae bacterium]|nr:pirin family protein [Ilumatobacteraceae bacterium]